MITSASVKKLAIISDLHLGNPFCHTKAQTIAFIRWAATEGYDLCINGDGLEIAQVSFSKLAKDVPDVFHALRSAAKLGHTTYYVVGNHDMALENFLEDWGAVKMAPFLNIESGDLRVRVEHGHLYDPFFVKSPRLYEIFTWLGGFFLKVNPTLYKLWIYFEKFKSRLWHKKGQRILGEPQEFNDAALELTERGFDAVVFGHTHHVGDVVLENGKRYLNPGSWLLNFYYIAIEDGKIELKFWEGSKAFQ